MTSANNSVPQVNNSFGSRSKQPDGDPFVRYTIDDDGLTQTPLRPIDDPVPDGAVFESLGIYFATESQREWLEKGGQSRNIQHQCRTDGRAYYRVVAESDALEGGIEATKVSQWLATFADDYLGIDADEYDLYFSGNRSVHLETDRFVDADGWRSVKQLVRAFNRETDGDLDTAIYSTLPQWRRIGVEHRKTGLPKIPIDIGDDRSAIVSKAIDEKSTSMIPPSNYTAGFVDRRSVSAQIDDRVLRPLIKESSTDDRTDPDKPFSPYANAGDGRRSLIAFRPFVNPSKRTDGRQYVFGKVIAAIGADGDYRRCNSFCDVLLSNRDAEKWSVEPGDRMAIIGGRSRSSRLIELDQDEAMTVSEAMQDEGIDAGFRRLSGLGYDVGTAERRSENYRPDDPNDRTEAAMIQQAIESGDREPDYDGIFRVSCRLLRLRGWRETVEWIENVYGSDFDPQRTHAHLTAILEAWPESFDTDEPDEPIDPSLASESAI